MENLSRYKYDNISTDVTSGESFEDTGIDGCYDFYEIGDGQCLPFEFQTDPNILVDICNNYYDCGQVSFSDCENGFDSNFNDISGICYPSEDGYCANFNYNNLFNSSSDECLNLDEDFCTGGCYWNVDDEVCDDILVNPQDVCTNQFPNQQIILDPNNDNYSSNSLGTEGNFTWDVSEDGQSLEPVVNDDNYGELTELDCSLIENSIWYGGSDINGLGLWETEFLMILLKVI